MGFSLSHFCYSFGFSFVQSIESAAISIAIAIAVVSIFSRLSYPGKAYFNKCFAIPQAIPTLIMCVAFVALFGKRGILPSIFHREFNILYTRRAIVLAHVFYNAPLAIYRLSQKISCLSQLPEMSGALMGKGNISVFFIATLPRLKRTIIQVFIEIFLYCFSSFSIVLTLGGGLKHSIPEVEIYKYLVMMGNHGQAIMWMASTFSVLMIASLLLERCKEVSSSSPTSHDGCTIFPKGKANQWALSLVYWLIVAIIIAPIVTVAYAGAKNATTSLIKSSFRVAAESVLVAFLSGAVSTSLSVVLATFVKPRALTLISLFPLCLSQIWFSFYSSLIGGSRQFDQMVKLVLTLAFFSLPMSIRILAGKIDKVPQCEKMSIELISKKKRSKLYINILECKAEIVTSLHFSILTSMGTFSSALVILGRTGVFSNMIYSAISTFKTGQALFWGSSLIFTTIVITALFSIIERKLKMGVHLWKLD